MFSARFQLAFRGDLRAYQRGVATANTQAVRAVTSNLKRQGRRQIERAGLGKRLANALRGEVRSSTGTDLTRRGADVNPVGRVFSNALVRRGSGRVDLLGEVFETGATIKGSPYLAVPTPFAGGRRAKPISSFPEGTFAIVPLRRGRGRPRTNAAAFVVIHKARQEVWYTLIPQVKLRKRLSLYALSARVLRTLPSALERAYERLFKRLKVAA